MPNGNLNPLRASILLLALVAAAQQQPPLHNDRANVHPGSPHENSALRSHTRLIPSQGAAASLTLDADSQMRRDTLPHLPQNERAVATYAPAEVNTAVRARPAPSAAGPNRGLSTRARSLQDWEVTDFVLLATVDGSIHARDRNTGKELWKFYSERPMIDIVHHNRTTLTEPGADPGKDFIFSVEPNNGGILYLYMPGPVPELQKLGITVRQLAEDLSPYADDASNFVYTAEKKTTLLTLNATNGNAIKFFGPAGAAVIDTSSCRPYSGLEAEEEECEPTPTINLGRTDYTVSIQDRTTGEGVCTIHFFEWTTNNRDRDLSQQYASAMDGKYIYSRFDGSINALKHDTSSDTLDTKPLYRQKLDSPVVRVFDVARPHSSEERNTALVLLPQPVPPTKDRGIDQQVFLNRTESGTWYALSEVNYPSVTDGAFTAKVYGRSILHTDPDHGHFDFIPDELIGVHSLSDGAFGRSQELIEGPHQHIPVVHHTHDDSFSNQTFMETIDPPRPWISVISRFLADTVISPSSAIGVVLLVAITVYRRPQPLRPLSANKEAIALLERQPTSSGDTVVEVKQETVAALDLATVGLTIGAGPKAENVELQRLPTAAEENEDDQVAVDGEGGDGVADEANGDMQKKKRKTHRGQRGGKKRKPKGKGDKTEKEAADEEIERIVDDVAPPRPLISAVPEQERERVLVANSMEELSQNVMIDRLVVYKDQVLGLGSGGTVVYQGKFEGRDVAVKRMLQHYFDLASQEVTLLQQSDDHPNVIRYFCHQKTSEFLYIAVERCQASLWDLYKDGGAREGLKEEQLSLLTTANSNVQNALYQIAAGLHHLHGLRIIHRDIKPQNILIAYPRPHQKALRLVISDFGLCRTLPQDVSTLIGTVGANAGTIGWKAPELIGRPDPTLSDTNPTQSSTDKNSTNGTSQSSNADMGNAGVKRAVDIFSLGCVFFYVLTNGGHPFDSKEEHEIWHAQRELNIKKGLLNLDKLKGLGEDESAEAVHLIQWMLAHKPENRPTAAQVLNHPFFWSPAKRLNFLCDVSDHFEREPRGPPFSVEPMSDALWVLEDRGEEIHGGDFLRRLDKSFIETLGKQRKYTGDRMLDLLRALRNKKNHWADMPEAVKVKVGALPEGYLRYWTHRFPRLVMVCWEVVVGLELEKKDGRFGGYLSEEGAG